MKTHHQSNTQVFTLVCTLPATVEHSTGTQMPDAVRYVLPHQSVGRFVVAALCNQLLIDVVGTYCHNCLLKRVVAKTQEYVYVIRSHTRSSTSQKSRAHSAHHFAPDSVQDLCYQIRFFSTKVQDS